MRCLVKTHLSPLTLILAITLLFAADQSAALSGTILNGNGLTGGLRWDAEFRTSLGQERSLEGGLRYSVQGGTFERFRNRFTWDAGAPNVSDFQLAIEQAFDAWESVDPATGLGTDLRFVPDLSTATESGLTFGKGSIRGAEIDLVGISGGVDGLRGAAIFFFDVSPVTLTSGTPNYPGTAGLSGVDIHMNTAKVWTLDRFRRTLTHEIGHAIGLGDLESEINPEFIDDNYDSTSSATALATLTNSWASRINPYDPASSPLSVFSVANGDPGIDTSGVDLLMESNTAGIGDNNPLSSLVPLTNDEYAMRQFLYPFVVPEPNGMALLTTGLTVALCSYHIRPRNFLGRR